MRVLIVEPSHFTATVMTSRSAHLAQADVVHHEDDAINTLHGTSYDVICLAYELGSMNGIELFSMLKASGLLGTAHGILLTTHDLQEVVPQALQAGFLECFTKGNTVDLEMCLSSLFQRRQETFSGPILLVEDSLVAVEFARGVLEEMGLFVDVAASVDEAMALFEFKEYLLVLADYMLKGTRTGATLVRQIRLSPHHAASMTPILAMSTFADTARRIELFRAGANDVLSKPVLKEELTARVSNLLTQQQLVTELEEQHRMMKHLALHDRLSSLYNRYHLEDAAPRLVEVAHSQNCPLSLIAIDVDHFKRINDSYGHAVGDQTLVAICKVLKAHCHGDSFATRCGGEEFLLLLPDVSQKRSVMMAEQLRAAIEALHPGGILVTTSFGVATLMPGETFEHVMKRADDYAYHAKTNGRNQVCSE